jgi:hypothetical protein
MNAIAGSSSVLIMNILIISVVRLLFSGVYRSSIAALLPRPILHRFLSPTDMKEDKLRKLHENLWYTVWHTLSFVLVAKVLFYEDWAITMIKSQDYRWTINSYPHSMSSEIVLIYLMELAFWVSCLFFLAVETVRKDVVEMFVHHCSTVGLIALSYMYSYHRIGLTVMLIHDIGDIFLYSAKFFNYLRFKNLTNVLFVLFVVVFFIFRLVIFPQVIRVAWGPLTGFIENVTPDQFKGIYVLPSLLSVLQALHVMWFVLILRMLFRMLKAENKQVEGDIRSDEEGDSSTEVTTAASDLKEVRKRK